MNNIYHDYLIHLRSCLKKTTPALSLYIPLVGTDEHPQKIFSTLMKIARNLLAKNGGEHIEIIPPDWERLRSRGAATVALFAQEDLLQLIALPTKLQPRVVVADSYHVKPIVAAANEYVESLMLHFHSGGATLYEVSPVTENILETYLPSAVSQGDEWTLKINRSDLRSYLVFLATEVKKHVKPHTKFFGISGSSHKELLPQGVWKYIGLPIVHTNDSFTHSKPNLGVRLLRGKMSHYISELHKEMILGLSQAVSEKKSQENLQDLTSKILKKEISFLCISLDDMAFGKLDLKNGVVIISQGQKDTRDDDLLDDLLELALDQGISVNVIPKKFFPDGMTFVAY